jgi:predicted DNA-binding antitoxin AbrB/MazE fold protein
MRIEYYHASEYGNGAKIAEEFKRIAETRGATVRVQHVRDAKPKEITIADLYLFSSPGRFGKPIGGMRKFLKKVDLPPGSRYAIIVTELNPQADKTGEKPAGEELGKCQQVIPTMNEALQSKGLTRVADGKIYVTGMKGPLEEGWQRKVEEFAAAILRLS